MTITIKKEHVYKGLIVLGALLGVVSIFCFFGSALELRYEGLIVKENKSVFNCMFGTNNAVSSAGLVVLFVFELIALLGGITLLVLMFMNKLNKKQLTIYVLSLAGLFLICAILSFCTKGFIYNATLREAKKLYPSIDPGEYIQEINDSFKYLYISSGPIWYSVLTLIGMISLGSSALIFNKKEQVQQN